MYAALALLALGLTACATAARPSHMAPDELLGAVRAGTAPVVVDVRTRREYDAGHVPGALHIPFYALLIREDKIPSPREQPVVVYCEHGPRAGVAKLALRLAGFTDVRYLEGHMSGWKERGFPMETATSMR
jgi:rhodanese-related sulfurtransferase